MATEDDLIRAYLDRLWADDWDCAEDAAYDEPVTRRPQPTEA